MILFTMFELVALIEHFLQGPDLSDVNDTSKIKKNTFVVSVHN